MRTIKRSARFKKDLKREMKGRHAQTLEQDLQAVLVPLATDTEPPISARDHALTGNWRGYRDCHLRPDLVLIYRKTGEELLLARLGSHSELNL